MAHTLTKQNFDIMREGLQNETTEKLQQFVRAGANKLTPSQQKGLAAILSKQMGFEISGDNLQAAISFVAHTSKMIIASR